MPLIQRTNILDTKDAGERVIAVLELINENFERYLDHLRVPARTSDPALLEPATSLYVGEGDSDLDLAIREHRALYGHEPADAGNE